MCRKQLLLIVALVQTLLFFLMVISPVSAVGVVAPQTHNRAASTTVHSLAGIIKNANGKAISGAAVTVGRQTVTSGADGRYLINRPSPGTFPVHVNKVEYTSYSGTITVNGTVTQDFTLSGAYKLSGYLRDPSGMPVPGAAVRLETQYGGFQGVVAADGRYLIDGLTLGNAKLAIYPSATEASRHQNGQLEGLISLTGNMTKDITYTLPGTGTLRGMIRDAATGKPLSGAQITVGQDKKTDSRADGSYSISGVKLSTSEIDHHHGSQQTQIGIIVNKTGYNQRQNSITIKVDTVLDVGMVATGVPL